MRKARHVSAQGVGSVAAGRDIRSSNVTVHSTHFESPKSYQGISVVPPFNLLPKQVHGRGGVINEIFTAIRRADLRGKKREKSRDVADRNPIWLLHGLGGVGKSTAALALARKAKRAGVRAFWVNAADSASIHAGMWRAARDLSRDDSRLPDTPAEPGAIDAIWDVLEQADVTWLLIFDNADDLHKLAADGQRIGAGNGWLRQSSRGIVVVTSRLTVDPASGLRVNARQIGFLEPTAGAKVLMDAAGLDPKRTDALADAERLAKRLGGFPLALRAAGRYVATSSTHPDGRAFQEYQDALDRHFSDFIDAGTRRGLLVESSEVDPRELVMTTWGLSLTFLADRGFPDATLLVRFIASLAPAPVPRALVDMLTRLDRGYTGGIANSFQLPTDPRRIGEVLEALQMLAIIDYVVSAGPSPGAELDSVVVMHPFVAEVMNEGADEEHGGARSFRSVSAAVVAEFITSAATRPESIAAWQLRAVESHVRAVAEAVAGNREGYHRRIARTFARVVGMNASRLTRFMTATAAVDSLSVYRDLATSLLGRHSKPTRSVRHELGHNLWLLQRQTEAAVELRASRNAYIRFVWRILPNYTLRLQAIGCGLSWDGLGGQGLTDEFDGEIVEFGIRWLRALRKTLFLSREKRLKIRLRLAKTLHVQGRYAEAEAEARAVVEVRGRVLGEDHPDTLASRHNLASAIHGQGRYAEAEMEGRAVVEVRGRVLGEDHPDTLASRYSLASAIHEQGRYAEAEMEGRAVVEVRGRVLGEDHPDTLASRHNLVTAIHEQGRYVEAEAEGRAVVEVRGRVLGEDHPDTLASRQAVVVSVHEQGRYAEAEAEGRAVLKVRRRVLGEDHPDTLASRQTVVVSVHKQGRYVEAEAECRAVIELRRRVLGAGHRGTLRSQHDLAVILREMHRYDEAEYEHRAVIDGLQRLGETHPDFPPLEEH